MTTMTRRTRLVWRPGLSRREFLVVSGVLTSLTVYLTTLLVFLA